MKKIYKHSIMMCLFAGSLASCKKTSQPLLKSSSLTIVNAINGAGTVVTNFDRNHLLSYYKNAAAIDSDSYAQFSGYIGKVPLQLVQLADTTKQVLNVDLDINPSSMQTLFLTGTLDKTDTMLVKDNLPAYQVADSLAGVRFVNLSPGSKGISINLQGRKQTAIVRKLAYKGVTAFMPFEVKKNTPVSHTYIFEFRDVVSGNLLFTYTLDQLNSILLKNVSVAFVGMQTNGTQSAILINNYLLDLGR